MLIDSNGNVIEALRDLDAQSIAWPDALKDAARLPTSRDDLCAAYLREATGSCLLRDQLVRTDDHALIVVRRGDLVIESAQGPFAVRQGEDALVPAGWRRITELPTAHSPVSYWIVFFGPGLLQALVGDEEPPRQAADQVAPVFSGVYVQRGLLRALKFHGCDGPVPDVEKTFRVIYTLAAASFFMFLREHYYAPRDALVQMTRACLNSRHPLEQIGAGWPGGARAFRQEFKRYHGVDIHAWGRREKKKPQRKS